MGRLTFRATDMAETIIFKFSDSQAVRLPKAMAFPEGMERVEIIRIGECRLITPVGKRWDSFFEHVPAASDDFMAEREQPEPEERPAL